jgi:predicted small secreted protein
MNFVKRVTMLMTAIILTFWVVSTLSGCNTVEGLGEDIESGAERIQDAADDE